MGPGAGQGIILSGEGLGDGLQSLQHLPAVGTGLEPAQPHLGLGLRAAGG